MAAGRLAGVRPSGGPTRRHIVAGRLQEGMQGNAVESERSHVLVESTKSLQRLLARWQRLGCVARRLSQQCAVQPLEVTVGLQRRADGAVLRPASGAVEGGRRAVIVQFIGGAHHSQAGDRVRGHVCAAQLRVAKLCRRAENQLAPRARVGSLWFDKRAKCQHGSYVFNLSARTSTPTERVVFSVGLASRNRHSIRRYRSYQQRKWQPA